MIVKRVLQTTFGTGGNCLTACLASVLGIGLDDILEVPQERWWQRMEEALSSHGRHPIWLALETMPKGLSLGSVESPRLEDELHSVVVHNGVIVWDPHPDQDAYGLPLVEGFIVLLPLVAKHSL